jgi:26S proteasome regulatory subunit N3
LKKKLAEPNLLQAFLDFALSPRSELHNLLSGFLDHQVTSKRFEKCHFLLMI